MTKDEVLRLLRETDGYASGEKISRKLGVSKPTVVVNLPYINGVNRLEKKSKNAKRCAKYRKKKQENSGKEANKTKITEL